MEQYGADHEFSKMEPKLVGIDPDEVRVVVVVVVVVAVVVLVLLLLLVVVVVAYTRFSHTHA